MFMALHFQDGVPLSPSVANLSLAAEHPVSTH
ncbi:hypothetical protein C5N14_04490 [Micromonospora sp. MW-13]|nr:hypothetical protein C5N14_04490 [Micromonospora sp. MW-13]